MARTSFVEHWAVGGFFGGAFGGFLDALGFGRWRGGGGVVAAGVEATVGGGSGER